MASASISLSTPFITPKTAFTPPPKSQGTVRFRQPLRISAVSATAGNPYTTTHITSQTSLYEVLGIQMGATCKEIKSAYRRLARTVHPDVVQHDDASSSSSSSGDEFMRVHAAYTTLFDPEKRANYDRKLFNGRRSAARVVSPATGFSGYTRRNWETDQCW